MKKVTPNTRIGEILEADYDVSRFFLGIGMHCLGCPSARNETVAQACEVHGADVDDFVEELNAFLENGGD